jgi:hypothetical protein
LNHYGSEISIIDQGIGSGFICDSTITLGDALAKLGRLEKASNIDKMQETLLQAARILSHEAKACQNQRQDALSIEISLQQPLNLY